MDFDFNEKEQALFSDIHDLMAAFSDTGELEAGGDVGRMEAITREGIKRLVDTPFIGLGIEKSEDFSAVTLMKAMELLGEHSPSFQLAAGVSAHVFGRIINEYCDEQGKEKWLAPLLKGEILGSAVLSEEALNIHNDPLKTDGTRDGDVVIVNGEKSHAVNAPIADWIAVAGKVDEETTIFLIEKGAEGLVIKEPVPVIGYEGIAMSGLELTNCRIPASQALGPFKGRGALDAVRMWEDQVLMGASLGMMSSSFQSAKAYANEHATGGKPIIAYQSVAFKLSEMLTLLQTSQLFAYRAVWAMETEKKKDPTLIDCAKVFCTESAEQVASTALQILAGKGIVAGNAADQAYRCAKYGQIAGTSAEIGRVKIGDNALGRPL